MSFGALLMAGLVVGQGQAAVVSVPDAAGLERVTLAWDGRQVPLAPAGGQWFTVIGVDLEHAPGQYGAELTLEFADGSTRHEMESIEVAGREFPTTELTVEPRYVELSAENQARAARESREIGSIYATLTPEPYWQAPFTVPLPGVEGGRNFGHRRIFNGQPRNPHSGADLSAASGTPVHAANRGRVVLAKELFFSGNAVFIDHGLGVYTVYLHLSEIDVAEGQFVARGERLGLAGATGRVTGPHLHWGARILDARVDPFTLTELSVE